MMRRVLRRAVGVLFAALCGAALAAPQQIVLRHDLPVFQQEALAATVARFNATQSSTVVRLMSPADGDAAPAVLVLASAAERDALLERPGSVRPLHQLLSGTGRPLARATVPESLGRQVLDARDRLMALPVAYATPLLFVNRARVPGLPEGTAPALSTWLGLQAQLGELVGGGDACPYTVSSPASVMVENLAAWHGEPTTKAGAGVPSINGWLHLKHLGMMASWHRSRYLQVFADNTEAERRFAAGECSIIAASSDRWALFSRLPDVDLAVLPLPYHDDFRAVPLHTVADGAALWVRSGFTPADEAAAAQFVRFWLQPAEQQQWAAASGFLPLGASGLPQLDAAALPLPPALQLALRQLQPAAAGARVAQSSLIGREFVRRILEDELSRVWSESVPVKAALDRAVDRMRAHVGRPG